VPKVKKVYGTLFSIMVLTLHLPERADVATKTSIRVISPVDI
jgi:hypothetical protein